MQVDVELAAGDRGVTLPRRFHLDGRRVEVIDNLDQWYGADHLYFKVRGDDGNLYILQLDEGRGEWDVTLFQRPEAERSTGHGGRTPGGAART